MNRKFIKSIFAGITGTIVMTGLMIITPMMGMPKMSQPQMLSGILGMPVLIGWLMHFMIGIIFSLVYSYLFNPLMKIKNTYLKGAIFGVIIFIFVQLMMAVIPIPKMQGSMMLMIIGGMIGHIVYGVTVSKMTGNIYCSVEPIKVV